MSSSGRRPEALAYQYLYKTKGWQIRRLWQLQREPFCRKCLQSNRHTIANTADHIIPHRGDKRLFWSRSNLQSLCEVHHGEKINEELGKPARAVIGSDGWPVGGEGRFQNFDCP
jgi:5-methylcytosine-specific restriction endonuclease McrA